tara:strand:- start:3728 stop:4678 length:951 start_codon:yes stop_codon:yes gene_type:complete
MLRYTLSDFTKILENGVSNKLSEETIEIINLLSKQVGSSEYIRTPEFRNNKLINNSYNNIKRKKKPLDNVDTCWESIRNFQTTELKKEEGIENTVHIIRKYLNMITINTYNSLSENIILEIDKAKLLYTNDDIDYLCNKIFTIVTSNILYSDIYSKLYKDLIKKYSIFNNILQENFLKFEEVLNNIEYYDPENNYDKFCENNKKNENTRALCSFYVNLMKYDIINEIDIANYIFTMFKILEDMIYLNDKKNELDELSELIYIMVTNSYEKISNKLPNEYKEIFNKIVKITNCKSKDFSGITNKCIFKHMDILDEIS